MKINVICTVRYQNIGRIYRQAHTQTDRMKTISRNPLRGEVINALALTFQITTGNDEVPCCGDDLSDIVSSAYQCWKQGGNKNNSQ